MCNIKSDDRISVLNKSSGLELELKFISKSKKSTRNAHCVLNRPAGVIQLIEMNVNAFIKKYRQR